MIKNLNKKEINTVINSWRMLLNNNNFSIEGLTAMVKISNKNISADDIEILISKFDTYEEKGFIGIRPKEEMVTGEYSTRFTDYLISEGFDIDDISYIKGTANNVAGAALEGMSKKIKGLVFGQVQSGKTTHFSMVINQLIDKGVKNILIMTSDSKDLQKQTQLRIAEAVTGYAMNAEKVGVNKLKNHFEPNTSSMILSGWGSDEIRSSDVQKQLTKSEVRLFVIKKNRSPFEGLKTVLKNRKNVELLKEKWVIIDDEADYASIDTTNKEDFEKRTSTNKNITDIMDMLKNVAYIGYTATPFANFMIDGEERSDLDPEFIQYIRPGKGYRGYEHFFIDAEHSPDGIYENLEAAQEWRHADLNKKSELIDYAVKSFIVDTLMKDKDNKHDQYTMVVNVAHKKNDHKEISELIFNSIERISDDWHKDKFSINKWIMEILKKEFYKDKEEIIKYISHNGKTRLVKNMLVSLLHEKRIYVQNSASQEDVFESAKYKILIGGFKFSRGLTVDSLTFFYIDRTSKNYDTILQQARFFGYRKTKPTLLSHPEYIEKSTNAAKASELLINSIITNNNEDAESFRAQIAEYSGLMPTARNKLGKPERAFRDINNLRARRIGYKKVNSKHVLKNLDAINSFVSDNIEKFGDKKSGTRLAKDIEWKDVVKLLNKLHFWNLNDEVVDQIRKLLSRLDVKFNVAIPSGDGGGHILSNLFDGELNQQSSKHNKKIIDNDTKVVTSDSVAKATDFISDRADNNKKRQRDITENNLLVIYNTNIDGDKSDTTGKKMFIALELSGGNKNKEYSNRNKNMVILANNRQVILDQK